MDEGLCPFLLMFSRTQNTYNIAYSAMCSSFYLRAAQPQNQPEGPTVGGALKSVCYLVPRLPPAIMSRYKEFALKA